MRMKYKNENGFALVMVLIVFTAVSILGLTLLSVVTSEHRFTNIDSRNQSTFYVAESGVNNVLSTINNEIETNSNDFSTAEDFFDAFEEKFVKKHEFKRFEENFGEEPLAEINVKLVDSGENFRDYKIESTGKIGNSTSHIYSVVTLSWLNNQSPPILDKLLFYTKNLEFEGSNINGVGGSAVSEGVETHNLNGGATLNISNMYFNGPVNIDGGSASFGSKDQPGTVYVNGDLELWNGTRDVYGDVRVNGNFRLKDAKIHGDVYVNGNLELGWTPSISKNIYYTGTLKAPNNFSQSLLAKCIKVDSVDSFDIPIMEVSLKEDSWYINNGYQILKKVTNTVPVNAKMFVENYNYTNWQNIVGKAVIVSKGDININVGNNFSGALIAPNGKVTVHGGYNSFTGVIVSKDGLYFPSGGTNIGLKMLSEFFDSGNIPVNFNNVPGGNGGGGESSSATLTIKSGIKEE